MKSTSIPPVNGGSDGLFERLQRAIEAGRTAVRDAEAAARPAPSVQAWIVLDELNRDAEPVRRRFLDAADEDGARPLFILSPLSEPDHARPQRSCEFLPLPEDLAEALDERPDAIMLYLQVRLAGILRKWQVDTCYWSGDRAGELVDLLRAEDSPITFRALG